MAIRRTRTEQRAARWIGAIVVGMMLLSFLYVVDVDARGHRAPPFRGLGEVRSWDGAGNNLGHPGWGAVGATMPRLVPALYDGDGSTMMAPPYLPNARAVSNALSAEPGHGMPHHADLSDLVTEWGQFLDHDMDLTKGGHEPHLIFTAPSDPHFLGTPIPMHRSAYVDGTGDASDDPRMQINIISSFIDASMVYGSDATRAAALRTFHGGALAQSADGLLPFNTAGLPNAPTAAPFFFLAGDVRANEQPGLMILHTVFVREHNRVAELILERHHLDPVADDEVIYQFARKIVGAEIQHITYTEWLPALLGPHAPRPQHYRYDPGIDATISTDFATSYFRFGHSLLRNDVPLVSPEGEHVGTMDLRDSFFSPHFLLDDPSRLEAFLRGSVSSPAQELDPVLVDAIRNLLFGPPGAGGLDLSAIDVERARDHGIPGLNTYREHFGLRPHASFARLAQDAGERDALASLYADVDDVEAFIGMLVEEPARRSTMGPTLTAVLADQFAKLRDGDRFFYTKDPDLRPGSLHGIIDLRHWSLADVLRANTDLEHVPDDVFHVYEAGGWAGGSHGDGDEDDEGDDDEDDKKGDRDGRRGWGHGRDRDD